MNLSRIDDSHHAADAQARDLRLPGNLGEVTAEGVRRELRFRVPECRRRLAVACDQAEVGAAQQIGKGHAFAGPPPSQRRGRSRTPDLQACDSRMAIPAWLQQPSINEPMRCPPRQKPHGTTDAVAIEPPEIGPAGSEVSPSATSTFSSGTPVLCRGKLRQDGVGSGADVLRGAGDAYRCRRRASCTLAAAANLAGYPRASRHSPAQGQAITLHRADARRALGPAKLFRPELEALDEVARGEREAQCPHRSSVRSGCAVLPDRS